MIAGKHSFDPVFTSQQIFRCLLDAMARPGKINFLPATGLCPPGAWNSHVVAVAFTLLDREVTFCVPGRNAEEKERYLAVNTGSRPVPLEEADFIIVTGQEETPRLSLAKRGTLEYPDGGATVIVALEAILSTGETLSPGHRGLGLTLAGPGIPGERRLELRGLHPSYLEYFKILNREYPLGVDWIMVAGDGRIACLPRTTMVRREEGF
ncbi:MAG: alpha-D-ribose 1-methylphosphonate 5-triphosphate synthase subunit PhnH [Moorella sp. (in: firmicutes)]|nr:alpha-D-ribose 1-methylphosphonate 5-triphosphate synthase subunit PhnH [Moorella sp. (in: firmicutes)]MDK2895202.1 alpha-D-ribose 1-methylphosphonate 5-triphosphate synthase subunit PhnH [Moorella sp. (in: firmicutes)]